MEKLKTFFKNYGIESNGLQMISETNKFLNSRSVYVFHNVIYDRKRNRWIFNGTIQPNPICFDRKTDDEEYMFKTEKDENIDLKNAKQIKEPHVLHRYNYPSCLWHIFMDGLLPTFYLGNQFDQDFRILRTVQGETRKFNNDYFAPPFDVWQPWLDLLGKETTILEETDSDVIVFRKLIVGFIPLIDIMNSKNVDFKKFRKTILDNLNIEVPNNPQKILFLNRKIERRRILNHEEVIRYLKNKGMDVEYAEFENMPFEEQIKKIVQTKTVIGAEGAGLFHSLFMKEGSELIAIYPRNYVKKDDCWSNLSKWANNIHYYIKAKPYVHEKHCWNKRFFDELEQLNPDNSLIKDYGKISFDNPYVRGIDNVDERSEWLLKTLVKNQNMEVEPEKIYETLKLSKYTEESRYIARKIFKNKKNGVFIEIGAGNPTAGNQSYLFENELGWSGLCIDGNPDFIESYKKQRSCIFENQVINEKEDFVEFHDAKSTSGIIKYFNKNFVKSFCKGDRQLGEHTRRVKATTLQKRLDKHNITHIDFCNIDVEKAELSVFKSIDFEKTIIYCFLVENHCFDKPEEIYILRDFLKSKGYTFVKRFQRDDLFIRNDE